MRKMQNYKVQIWCKSTFFAVCHYLAQCSAILWVFFFARRQRNWKSLSVSTLENCTNSDRNQQCPNPMKYSTTCRFATIIIDQEAEIWIPKNISQYWKNFQAHNFVFRGKTELRVSTIKFTCHIVFMQWAMADERGGCHGEVVTTLSCRHSSPLLCPAHTNTTLEGLLTCCVQNGGASFALTRKLS